MSIFQLYKHFNRIADVEFHPEQERRRIKLYHHKLSRIMSIHKLEPHQWREGISLL